MNKKGFTLIELLAVIVILGIVVAIAIPGINSVISNSRQKSLKSEVRLIHSAAMRKYASEPSIRFSDITKDNLSHYLETDGKQYDYVHISNNKEKIFVTIKKDGYTATTDGKENTSFNLPPFVAFEYDLSLGESYVNIKDSELATQTIFVYEGNYKENKSNIEKGFKKSKYEWSDLKYNDDLRTKLGKTSGIYTIIATKMTETGGTTHFDNRIKNYGLIGVPHFDLIGLNTINLRFLFYYSSSFNQDISHWDTKNITNISYMFDVAKVFDMPLNSWDVSNVTNMYSTFRRTDNFNQDLSYWDVSNVNNMGAMFQASKKYSYDLSNWNVTKIINKPTNFDLNSNLMEEQLPIWGTNGGN